MKRDYEMELAVDQLWQSRVGRDRAKAHLDAMKAKEQKAVTKLNWFMGGMMFGFAGGFLACVVFG